MSNESDSWITVAEVAPELDSQLLAMELERYRIFYRFVQEGHQNLLQVSEDKDVQPALTVLRQYQKIILQQELQQNHSEQVLQAPSRQVLKSNLLQQALKTPVVLVTILLGVLGALLVRFTPDIMHWLTFQEFEKVSETKIRLFPAEISFERGEYWRLLTPAFLHFGVLHIVFNSLWIWEFGRRIELLVGKTNFILIALGIAIGANLGQYLWQPNQIFGGLSGVVYGLLGYVWIRNLIAPQSLLRLPPGIIAIMLIWLLVCWLGIVDLFLQGGIANGAHIVGLVIGMAFGGLAGFSDKNRKPNGF